MLNLISSLSTCLVFCLSGRFFQVCLALFIFLYIFFSPMFVRIAVVQLGIHYFGKKLSFVVLFVCGGWGRSHFIPYLYLLNELRSNIPLPCPGRGAVLFVFISKPLHLLLEDVCQVSCGTVIFLLSSLDWILFNVPRIFAGFVALFSWFINSQRVRFLYGRQRA